MFVQWCFAQAGYPLLHKSASCSDLFGWYRKYAPERIVATPQPRDIIIYNFGHTGMSRSTVQYRRTSSFDYLKQYLEEHADEWDEW